MKKLLLSFLLALVTGTSAFAVVDPNKYDAVNDIKIKNVWLLDRAHAGDAFISLDACNAKARTAVMCDGVVYVARSEAKAIITGTDTISAAVIYRFDAKTGEQLPTLDVTYNGGYVATTLGANNIGVDNFGHLWVAPYTSELASKMPLYSLNPETGELTLIAEFDKGDVLARTDYVDVIGDITREEAPCNVMTPGHSVATIYGWHCDQGGSRWEGFFEGDTYLDILDFYPETVTSWGIAPYARFIVDAENEESRYDGALFYVDGFTTMPALYDNTGTLIESFENVPTDLWPLIGTNGVAEFTLDGRNFIVYSIAQYEGYNEATESWRACQANICELGEGMSLEGMTKYWQIPADRLGDVSDSGTRIHCFNVEYATEDDSEVVYLFDFKCYNGMGVYKIGKNLSEDVLKGDVNGDGRVNVSDVSTLINMILGTSAMDQARADVNGDGRVNVSDVSALINIILGIA